MEKVEYRQRRKKPGSRRGKTEKQILSGDAETTLQKSKFGNLADRLAMQNPGHISVSRVRWNERGEAQNSHIPGLPNASGIIIEWDRKQNIITEGGRSFREVTSLAVIIVANPYGGISIEGESIVGMQLEDWKSQDRTQVKAFVRALKAPKNLSISKQLPQSKQGIPRI